MESEREELETKNKDTYNMSYLNTTSVIVKSIYQTRKLNVLQTYTRTTGLTYVAHVGQLVASATCHTPSVVNSKLSKWYKAQPLVQADFRPIKISPR